MKYDNLTSPPRQRTSVAIQGIDRSTPDDLCKDGTCQELHNLRWKDSAWRPVCKHKEKLNMNASRNIVYHHPAAGENVYIQCSQRDVVIYSAIDLDPSKPFPLTTEIARFNTEQKISHFGNVLMFSDGESSKYFLLSDGSYKELIIPYCASTEIINSSFSFPQPALVRHEGELVDIRLMSTDEASDFLANNYFPETVFHLENVTTGTMINHNVGVDWNGEILLFTTFRMEDGTNLCPSPLHLVKSHTARKNIVGVTRTIGLVENGKKFIYDSDGKITGVIEKDKMFGIEYRTVTGGANAECHAPTSDPTLRSASHLLRIRVPEDISTSAIKSVALWATPINPTYRYDRLYTVSNPQADIFTPKPSSSNVDYYSELSFGQQFYLFDEFDISRLEREPHKTDPIYTGFLYVDVLLDGVSLSNIIYKPKYTPDNNIHTIAASAKLDYNDRLHHADYTMRLQPPFKAFPNAEYDDAAYFESWVDIPINNRTYKPSRMEHVPSSVVTSGSPFYHLLSYPDFRASHYNINDRGRYTLFEATGINYAYYHAPHTELEKFPPIDYELQFVVEDSPIDQDIVEMPNRIQVSSPNNPFSFPFDTSYSIGSSNNRIISLQSAAIENSDEKIGEHPLYVFTEEGIFALRAGSETLYARVDAINYDKIINPNTLAINGGIVYITEKGVHLLTNAGSTVISTPIHDANGMPPLDFLRTCKILWPKQYNEIVLFKEGTPMAYVFNLDAAYWSTRELSGKKINTDELVARIYIYDLSDEDENKALPCSITTRPIKLGNVEFKRLETIIPRMSTNNHPALIDLQIDGSVDGSAYRQLRMVQAEDVDAGKVNPIVLRRTPFSAKYFKCKMLMEPEQGESFNPSITHIDFEWYQRFMARMR